MLSTRFGRKSISLELVPPALRSHGVKFCEQARVSLRLPNCSYFELAESAKLEARDYVR